MAERRRAPLTDEQLMRAEREQNLRHAVADMEDALEADNTELAASGEPEAVEIDRLNRQRERDDQARLRGAKEAIDALGAAQNEGQEQPPPIKIRPPSQALRVHATQPSIAGGVAATPASTSRSHRLGSEEERDLQKADKLMTLAWLRWARKAPTDYIEASRELATDLGRSAVTFLRAGFFTDTLALVSTVQRLYQAKRAEGTDQDAELDEMIEKFQRELRGDDTGDE